MILVESLEGAKARRECLAMRLENGLGHAVLTRMSITHITSLSQLDKLLGNKNKLTVS